jgi:hypothetical protein
MLPTLVLLGLAALAFFAYYVLPMLLSLVWWLAQLAFSLGVYVVVILGAWWLLCWAL